MPTVVYGFFAALTVAPFIRDVGESIGLDVASESALAAGLVMGVMIIPFVSSISDDVITAVPQVMRDGSLGLGATKSETIRKVVFPAAAGIRAAPTGACHRRNHDRAWRRPCRQPDGEPAGSGHHRYRADRHPAYR